MRELFEERFSYARAAAVVELEDAVLGSTYGGSSYTTAAQAGEIAELLRLAPGRVLLSIGAGAGWPSLHLAATSGCSALLTDPTSEGLRTARDRAAAEGIVSWFVRADGALLPVGESTVDAVEHSDVLC